MKHINLKSLFSWTMTHISWVTMAFSPVAMGKEVENFQTQKIKNDIQALGLNKKMTVAEFWNKSKFYIPGYAYADFEKLSKQNASKPMPQFEVKSTKNSLGEDIPTLHINDNGKTTTVQLIGEPDKYVKVNNQFFTETEVQNPKVFFTKMIKNDPKLMKEHNQEIKKNNYDIQDQQNRPFRNFSGLPRFNKTLWAAMTVQQRVAYIVEMRLLNEKATLVQEAFAEKNKKSKKTSAYESFKKYQAAWEFLVGEANAGKDPEPFFTGEHCINQGFIAESKSAYNKLDDKGKPKDEIKLRCNLQTILTQNSYKNPLVQKAVADCKSDNNQLPCNPLVYSFHPTTGKAFCSGSPSDPSFQRGTHFNGSCDNKARLSGHKPDYDTFINVKGLRTQEEQNKQDNIGNEITEEIRNNARDAVEITQSQDSFLATEAYLKGMLLATNKDKNNDLLLQQLEGKIWSKELESELLKIQVAFENNIKISMDTCSADLKINSGKNHEPNFRNACEQLHRRWLFTEKFIARFKCNDIGIGGISTKENDTPQDKDKYKDIKAVVGTKACAEIPIPPVVVEPATSVTCPEGSKQNSNDVWNFCKCDTSDQTFPAGPTLPEKCTETASNQTTPPCKDNPEKEKLGTCKCDEDGTEPQIKNDGILHLFSKTNHQTEKVCAGINWWMVGGTVLAGAALLALINKNRNKNTKCTNGGNPPDCIVNSQCPAGSTGTPPDKCFAAGKCPIGATTPFPDCLAAGKCPAGTTGTFPSCVGSGQCPAGTTGIFPNCFGPGQCPPGSTGSFPNCYGNVTCQGSQQLINGSCRCPSSCTISGSTQNPVSCVCSAPPNEGGSGSPTCRKPPCAGGVPAAQ